METIYNVTTLNQKIQLLENQQDREWCAIKEEIEDIKENLKPLNLIRNTVEEINETVGFKSNMAKSVISIGLGYLTKRIVVGKSNTMFKGILGSALQLLVTNMVSKPQEASKEEESFKNESSQE